jgi:MFS transporter, DHA3 family, tetracycline resistance protein
VRQLQPYTVYRIYSGVLALLRSLHFTAVVFYYVTVVGLNPFQLVLVGTTLMTVILVGEVPTGVVADTYSRRLSVIIGVALMGAGFLVEGAVAHFAAVLAAQVIWGLGATFTSGALEAWIADELGGADLDVIYLRGSQIGSAGALVGIAGSVALAGVRLNLPLIVSGLGLLALAAFLALAMPERGFTPRRHADRSAWSAARATLRAGVRLVWGRAALLTIMGITFFFAMASESFDRLWEVHFLSRTGFPALDGLTPVAWFGMINAGALLLSIGAASLAQSAFDTRSTRGIARMLAIVTALVMAGMFGFGLARSFTVALLAYWAAYLMRRLYEPLYMAWLNQHTTSEVRATVLSLAGQVDAVGQIAGGPLFGLIATAVSTAAAIVAAGCALVPALLLYRPALRRGGTTNELEHGAIASVEG